MDQYAYIHNAEQHGPVDRNALESLIRDNIIDVETLIWRPGLEEWKSIQDMQDELKISTSSSDMSVKKNKKKNKKKRKKINANMHVVYIKGLPIDVSIDEINEVFVKCGLIVKDVISRKPVIVIKKNLENNSCDALVQYLKYASVELAVQILHESQFRDKPEFTLQVRAASEEETSLIEPTQAQVEDERLYTAAKKVRKLEQDQALSWNDEGTGVGGLKFVVLKNLFDPNDSEVQQDPSFSESFAEELKEECETLGLVKKVTVFQRHPEGVAIVKFRASQGAQRCLEKMNGRWFDGRKVEALYWDGVTDYRPPPELRNMDEDDHEEAQRLDAFASFLEETKDDIQT